MGRKRRSKGKEVDFDSESDDEALKSVIFLISSDDEEANKDLSLAIVERAREREVQRKKAEDGEVIVLSSTSDEIEGGGKMAAVEEKSRGSRGKKKKKYKEVDAAMPVDAPLKEEVPLGTADSVVTEVNEASDNVVLRKLLRGPRYFDAGDRNLDTCFNCGEEGHTAVNCTMERRKKPCFVCGMFGHNAKRCTLGQDCFICKRRGHIAKNCPDKHQHTQDSIICLRCGDLGHDMLSCKNDCAPDDLKEIQCYICKNYGHLCCVDFIDNSPREISCYNCAQSGHSGLGCAKPRGENNDVASPTLCYRCGEEGHFARGCTKYSKFDRWEGGSSTRRFAMGFRSVPHDFGKAHKKKKSLQYEERWNMTTGKSKIKGGWNVDDPGDLPKRKHKANGWKSPSTPVRKNHKVYSSASGGHYSSSQSPFKKHKSFIGTPSSNASTGNHHHGYSASRFGKSQGRFGRS